MDIIELKQIIKDNGIADVGYKSFPAYAKLDTKIDTIILNCAEYEPLIKVNRQLLQKYVYEILDTLNIISSVVGAVNVLVAVKSNYTDTIEAVKANLDSFETMELKLLPEIYPSDDEIILVYELTGRKIQPATTSTEIGVAVLNVETVLNIYRALNNNEPEIYKYVTVAGEINNPVTVKAPIGITVAELIEYSGGCKIENPVFIMGGAMTGSIVTPYNTITKTSNAVLVIPKTHNIINKRLSNTSTNMKRAMSTCCQCHMCTDLCPRNLLGYPIEPHAFINAAINGNTADVNPFLMTMFCSGCGLCEMYSCSQSLSPRSLISEYKNGLKKRGIEVPKNIHLSPINPMRETRKVSMRRLTQRIGLAKYDINAPLKDEAVQTKFVKIPLNQSTGLSSIPAIPIVNKNDIVSKGQTIGIAAENEISLPIHASIAGIILDINSKYITIKQEVI